MAVIKNEEEYFEVPLYYILRHNHITMFHGTLSQLHNEINEKNV